MTGFYEKLMIAVDPAILAIVLAYSYGLIARVAGKDRTGQLAMGCVMGVAAIVAMISPIPFADGVIVDMRNLIVGLSGAFFGVAGALVTAILAVIMRVSIGGTGMTAGVAGIVLSATLGLAWARWVRPRMKYEIPAHIVLGLMISGHLFSAALLPAALLWDFMISLAPWLTVLNVIGALVIGALIAHEKRIAQTRSALISAASTDPLTNLLNRRSLIELFDNLVRPKQPDSGTAMLSFDIDHFKKINDTHGHLWGDQVLIELKKRIASCLRPSDLFARIGGDEFLIVLSDVSQTETVDIAERCRAVICQHPLSYEGKSIAVTISIGANWTAGPMAFDDLLAETDIVLYEAKARGRNCVAYGFRARDRSGFSVKSDQSAVA